MGYEKEMDELCRCQCGKMPEHHCEHLWSAHLDAMDEIERLQATITRLRKVEAAASDLISYIRDRYDVKFDIEWTCPYHLNLTKALRAAASAAKEEEE